MDECQFQTRQETIGFILPYPLERCCTLIMSRQATKKRRLSLSRKEQSTVLTKSSLLPLFRYSSRVSRAQFLRPSRASTVLHALLLLSGLHLVALLFVLRLLHSAGQVGATFEIASITEHMVLRNWIAGIYYIEYSSKVSSGDHFNPRAGPSMNTTLSNLRASKARHRSA